MGLVESLKSLFKKKCAHVYVLSHVVTEGFREGTMIVVLSCEKCGSSFETFHDLTETEQPVFRQPGIEELLYEHGYLVKKKNKILTRLKWNKPRQKR